MKSLMILGRNARKVLALVIAVQALAITSEAQSQRARERASDNARFNRADDYERDRDRDRDRERDRDRGRRFMSDEQFIQQAYERGYAETQLAGLAVKSQDADIQKIGHRIINEQGRANAELKKLADERNITLNRELTGDEKRDYDRLKELSGTEFDNAYRDHLKSDYKRTIQLYQDAARLARDQTVRDTASQYANLFEEHAQVIGITGLGSGAGDRSMVREREREREADRSATATGALSEKDQQFVTRAHRMSRGEVEAARLAVKNARDRQLRDRAQRVLDDHQKMEQDLADLASRRGVNLSRQLGEGQQDVVEKLRNLSGSDFDREYRDYLQRSHRNATELFSQGSASSDPDVRRFADKYSSVIREHLNDVQGRRNR